MEKRKKPRFLRKDWHKCIRLGGKKKNRVWRASKGRHGKVRQKWKNRQKMPSIGYGMPREIRGLVRGMNPVMINNIRDLSKVGKGDIAIMRAAVGNKKRIEIVKKAVQMNIEFSNLDSQKFLEEFKDKSKPKEEKK